jgi:peroxiredoxin
MNNRIIALIALLLAIAVVSVQQVSKKPLSLKRIERIARILRSRHLWVGKFAPDFELQLDNEETFHLANVAGKKVVILNFFTTWCGACRADFPELNRYYLKHKDDPFIMIGINANEKEGRVRAFLKEVEISFPVGIDTGDRIAEKYGVESYPTTVLINPQGRVRFYETGAVANADVAFEKELSMYCSVIKKGGGISREAYLEGQQHEDYTEIFARKKGKLKGQAAGIAERIYCPCGRGRRLANCNCFVARKIKNDLRRAVREGKTDEEIIEELSKKYCVVKQ